MLLAFHLENEGDSMDSIVNSLKLNPTNQSCQLAKSPLRTLGHSALLQAFTSLAERENIFSSMQPILQNKDLIVSEVVGVRWYHFSEFMPWFLTRMASLASTNRKRAAICQIAYEELGEGNPDKIHANEFIDALSISVDIKSEKFQSARESCFPNELKFLSRALEGKDISDPLLFGISLGLEIVAIENIETLFEGVCYDEVLREKLGRTEFFIIHRQNEEEHIRHTTNGFINHVHTDQDEQDFMHGFYLSLKFWKQFWNNTAELCKSRR